MKAYEHLVRYALTHGARISVFDGEEWEVGDSTDQQAIIDCIESVEEAEIVIKDPIDGRSSWARISAFGLADDETVVDHTLSSFMAAWENSYSRYTAPQKESDRLLAAAQRLATGQHGGFAAAIGDAATRADSTNLRRLAAAFPELFAVATATA
jgi:hypothetical protein